MPELTQKLKLHLNGGAKFSGTEYEILADGQPTGIILVQHTSGRSTGYKYTKRELHFKDEAMNLMDPESGDPIAWINARLP